MVCYDTVSLCGKIIFPITTTLIGQIFFHTNSTLERVTCIPELWTCFPWKIPGFHIEIARFSMDLHLQRLKIAQGVWSQDFSAKHQQLQAWHGNKWRSSFQLHFQVLAFSLSFREGTTHLEDKSCNSHA